MGTLKGIFFLIALYLLGLHGFSLLTGIENLNFRFSSFDFSIQDNIDGIYAGFFCLFIYFVIDYAEEYAESNDKNT